MPLATLAPTITPTGITAPSYADILLSLQESFRTIYGSDAYIAPDSQDGQLLAIFASAINDQNNQIILVYQTFSPTYAQGVGLSSLVKLNGLQRLLPSFSSAVGTVTGTVGTIIPNGIVQDTNGHRWALPASVTIPPSGDITVTVTAVEAGAIAALSGTIDTIATPILGWQTFVSTADAAVGAPVESDAQLRLRQSQSTSLPAESVLGAVFSALANLAGVTRVAVYENPTGSTDANGLPAHSISCVILGGDSMAIAETIGQKKTPGAATHGSTPEDYTDPVTGIVDTINYYVLALNHIKVAITGNAGAGYSSLVAEEIKQSVAAYVNGLGIGETAQYLRMFAPSYLNGAVDGLTYEITALTTAKDGGSPGVIDIPITFNHAAFCDPAADVTVTIT